MAYDILQQHIFIPARLTAQANVLGSARRLDCFERIGEITLVFISEREYFIQNILRTNEPELESVLSDIGIYYRELTLPKADGVRTIRAIDRRSRLYSMQKNLCKYFLEKIPLPLPAIGFIKNESYISFLAPHTHKGSYLRLDIKDFFGAISSDIIFNCFKEFFSDEGLLKIFTALCTYDDCLPQGAVTSPAISNIIMRRADQRILKYCQSFDIIYRDGEKLMEEVSYTRYADDMLFSSNHIDFSEDSYFAGMIGAILKDFGFSINKSKVKLGNGQISLSGHVVGKNIHLSRKKLYSINKLIHFFGKTEQYVSKKYRIKKVIFHEPNWLDAVNQLSLTDGHGAVKRFNTHLELLDYICGYRAFLISIIRGNQTEDSSVKQLRKKVKKIEDIVDAILKHC